MMGIIVKPWSIPPGASVVSSSLATAGVDASASAAFSRSMRFAKFARAITSMPKVENSLRRIA